MHRVFRLRSPWWLATVASLAVTAHAQDAGTTKHDPQQALSPVVVTATRLAQDPYDVAASTDAVKAMPDDQLNVNLSQYLDAIPGVLARDRQNYAQDEQISIRGFGARAPFGIRGVRLYTDGIPATMPDGQGQVSHFNLDSAERVEVLRGPFSALYGNASGGVIQLFTADGTSPPQVRLGLAGGSDGTLRAEANARGVQGPFDYNVDFTHFQTDGYRDHSRAKRESGNAKLNWQLDPNRKLTLVVNTLNLPEAQDPQGLTPQQYAEDPRQAATPAEPYNTRKSVSQQQGGLIYDDQIDDANALRVMGYYGQRSVLQYLSIPPFAQASPLSSGAVVDLGNTYGGADVRWTWEGQLAGRPFQLAAGLTYDNQRQRRRGYNNFVGTTLGVRGALRRDEEDRVYDLDQYAQATWTVSDAWTLMAGVRHNRVDFDSRDHYITATNPDDSGRVRYTATTPVAGVMFRASPKVHFYADYGKGFETPTFSELAYRSDGVSGLNLGLRPATTHSAEAGVKLRPSATVRADIAVFRADSKHELAVDTNVGGRSTYQNIDRARRQGLEASLQARPLPWLTFTGAYTYLDATYRSAFLTCVSAGCAVPDTLVAAGARIPGVPRSDLYLGVRMGRDTGWQFQASASHLDKVPVDDLNTTYAPAYTLFNLGAGYVLQESHWRTHLFARIDNAFDRTYVGSVRVNDGNGRYFEPGPGRTWLLGVDLRWEP
ncbi:TonB-dependent receptor family protein [Oleiagrimonas soli]|uniref:Iron complex outermembrane receptor protein n=1 Tax=Oleiagrimonas soli TaxID=1543381 RepID=A0A099CZ84_9GAMM|nr:TonB-dependent receptor [Oleiagrimonas soli]KGI79044.1 ligand-gated channel [Oleiagrimonas soli]MBB6184590.1 iron complex outermembrane receptor protein [Oleiagrimonas soli]